MKKRGFKEKFNDNLFWIIPIGCLIILILIVGIFYQFFYYKNCKDKACFDDSLGKCKRSEFIKTGGIDFEYKILGREGDFCIVQVKYLSGDLSEVDAEKLIGRSMECEIPRGMIVLPEDRIDSCHGALKEGLQDMIIQRLHTYILQNLGKINYDAIKTFIS